MTKKILSLILSVVICVGLFIIPANAATVEEKLKFNADGTFKIVQLTDFQDTQNPSKLNNEFLKRVAQEEKPDLFVLTGDNISEVVSQGYTAANSEKRVRKAIDAFMSVFEEIGIPVVFVFGNHDDEGGVAKELQMQIYNEYDCCIAIDEGDELYGCGTYDVPIYSSNGEKIAYNLYMFDSGSYDEATNGYDYIRDDQINWYVNRSNELKQQNGGKVVPALAFQHIIVREIYAEETTLISSVINESPCPSGVDTLQVTKMLEQGDVQAMFFGHDHENDFVADYKGLKLINTPASGFGSYGADNRGARVIVLNENSSSFETRLIDYLDDYCESPLQKIRYHINNIRYLFVYFGYGLTYPIKLITNLF